MNISIDEYKKLVKQKFIERDVSEEHSDIVADILLHADSK